MAQKGEGSRAHEAAPMGRKAHDVLIMVEPWLAHYLLRLLTNDIVDGSGSASLEQRQQIIALACYICDVLPEHLRLPLSPAAGRATKVPRGDERGSARDVHRPITG